MTDKCWCGSGTRGEHANGTVGHYAPATPSVWRGRVEVGAVVSWRHPNPSVNRREVGTVVEVGTDTLTVDIVDRAGTYRARMTTADMPGLTVDVRPYPNGGARSR